MLLNKEIYIKDYNMYFIGDTHGIAPLKMIVQQVSNQNLIHVGDFGLGFKPLLMDLADLEKLDNLLGDLNNILYVIRGNHDNPIFWKKIYGLNLPKYQNIHLIDDYTIKNIEGKNILFMGGAISIDRLVRGAEHPPTWWAKENFEYDLNKLKTVLDTVKDLDIVVTHTTPGFVQPYLKDGFPDIVKQYVDLEKQYLGTNLEKDLTAERLNLSSIYSHIEINKKYPTHWFYGHFHKYYNEIHDKTRFIGLHVNQLYEL